MAAESCLNIAAMMTHVVKRALRPTHLRTTVRMRANFIALEQGSPNFFVQGPHNLLHNSSRAGHLA